MIGCDKCAGMSARTTLSSWVHPTIPFSGHRSSGADIERQSFVVVRVPEGKIMPTISSIPPLGDDEVARLDAAENTILAPVRGADPRRSLAREYFVKKP